MKPDDCCVEDGGWFGDCGDVLADVELLKLFFGGHFSILDMHVLMWNRIDVVRSY